jgi:hypothetical protein
MESSTNLNMSEFKKGVINRLQVFATWLTYAAFMT